jgi:hypothetical protein
MTPAEFTELAQQVTWRRSPGYQANQGYQVGPHEYIICQHDPVLWDKMADHIKQADDAFLDVYPPVHWGAYKRYSKPYVIRGEWVYWIMFPVLNRELVEISELAKLRAKRRIGP